MSEWEKLKRTARGILSLLSTLPEILAIDDNDIVNPAIEEANLPLEIDLEMCLADSQDAHVQICNDNNVWNSSDLDGMFRFAYRNSGFFCIIITESALGPMNDLKGILDADKQLIHPDILPQWVLALHTIYYGRIYVANEIGIIYPVHLEFIDKTTRQVMVGDPITPQHCAKWDVNYDASRYNSALNADAYPILMFDDPIFWKGAKHRPKTEDERAAYVSELKANAEEIKRERERAKTWKEKTYKAHQEWDYETYKAYDEAKQHFEDFFSRFWGQGSQQQTKYDRASNAFNGHTTSALTQVQKYAAVLSLSLPCSDVKALKKAYRQAALKTHPDTNGAESVAAFQAVNEAYSYLLRCFEDWEWKVLQ